MQLLLGLQRVEILLGAAQLVQEKRVLFICQVYDQSLLLACTGCRMEGYFDIQILRKIFSVLCPESDCNLARMQRLIELKLLLL